MIADNNLDYYAMANIRQMEQGIPDDKENNIFVFVDRNSGGNPSHPYLLRVIKNTESDEITSPILRVYSEQNSCDPSFLRQVIADVKYYSNQRNAELRRLVLWSHGTGWLPEGTPFNEIDEGDNKHTVRNDNTGVHKPSFSFGLDDNGKIDENTYQKEMSIKDVAFALAGEHFELLLLDACFMGTIEVAYELRKSCDYLLVSPSEIVSSGFPYIDIVDDFTHNAINPLAIAVKFFNYYSNKKNALQSATISVIDTRYLTDLASKMKPLYADYVLCKDKIPIHELTQYDRTVSNYFFDFKSFVSFVSGQTKNDYSDVLKTYEKALPFYLHTSKMFDALDLIGTSGLSVYVPNTFIKRSELHEYYKTLLWFQDSHADILFD
jgi:hypothetical protein